MRFFRKFYICFKKLNTYFEVNHIHPNNCCGITKVDEIIIPNVLEVTFF